MKVFSPSEYSIEMEKEEIDVLLKAYGVLNTMYNKMLEKNCDTLEGGYEDCPIDFSKQKIFETKEFLMELTCDIPTKMY